MNDERVKGIEKLKSENREVREEVSGLKKNHDILLERMNINESNFNIIIQGKNIFEK